VNKKHVYTQYLENIYHTVTHRHKDFGYDSQQWWQLKQKKAL